MNYLVSYNRSGNTWVRYILEYLTRKPTWGHQKFSISERMGHKSNITLLSTEPIIIKRHEIIPNEIKDTDKVVFLLRDYKECIWNSMDCKWEKFESEFVKYWNLIKFFDNFEGEKLLLHYEDLSEYWIHVLLDFLKVDDSGVTNFFENIEHHREISFSIYNNTINTKNGEIPTFTDEELRYMRLIYDKYVKSLNEH